MWTNLKLVMVWVTFVIIPSFAQQDSTHIDVGIFLSSEESSRVNVEVRKPVTDRLYMKLGVSFGEWRGSQFNQSVIYASDSLVAQRNKVRNGDLVALRLGVDRAFTGTPFSFGLDLNLGYGKTRASNFNNYYVKSGEAWGVTVQPNYYGNESLPFEKTEVTGVTRYYFVPGLRLSGNMDLSLGNGFLLHFSAMSLFSVPVYMGATDFNDPYDEFIGTPNSVFDLRIGMNAGIRYQFGHEENQKPNIE